MAFLAIDKKGRETIHEGNPNYDGCEWYYSFNDYAEGEYFTNSCTIDLPKGTIAKILGRELTFEESPIEI